MAGLFELQLPNESPRRSNDAARSSVAVSRSSSSRMQSPPAHVAAREIVNQVKAKQRQQEGERQTSMSSHFPHASSLFSWRRKGATLPHDSPRISQDSLNGYSSDTLRHNSTPVTVRDMAKRPATATKAARGLLTQSPRQSFSLDTLAATTDARNAETIASSPMTDSFPDTDLNSNHNHNHNNVATTALAQAGFSLSIPSIVLSNRSSPSMKSTLERRKKDPIARPGTSHGPHSGSPSDSPPAAASQSRNGTVRKVKSFTKLGDVMANPEVIRHDHPSTPGDILVFSRHPSKGLAGVPLTRSMPEHDSSFTSATTTTSSSFSFFSKGKSREVMSDTEDVTTAVVENVELQRGRLGESSTANAVPRKEREKSITRRLSWWPRRRVDSAIPTTSPSPPVDPPPLPARSRDRPAPVKVAIPALPSFRPFSPLMGDFRSPDPKTPKELSDTKDAKLTESYRQSSIRRRHSLGGHSNQSHSTIRPIPSSLPTSQTFSASHRYSLSSNTTEHGYILSDGAFPQNSPPASIPSDTPPSRTASTVLSTPLSSSVGTRPRPNTQSSNNSLTQINRDRDTPLLLRQPLNRPNSSGEPLDPFHSMRSAAPIHLQQLEVSDSTPTPSRSDPVASSTRSSENLPVFQVSTDENKLLSASATNGSPSASFPPPATSTRLLRRLSTTLFPSSTTLMLTTPIDKSSIDLSSPNLVNGVYIASETNTPRTSGVGSSPSRSKENLSHFGTTRNSAEEVKVKASKATARLPDEMPEEFLLRLLSTVNRAEVAHVLASSGDEFYTQALRLFLSRFKFTEEPLDVALRRLLMEIGLPKETQQIDRMMEAFAARYLDCNSDLFADKDHPYILSFSLIILHTDVFNKSNKNKMSKGDYVKNTRLPGVSQEVLEYFYDNIIFAPFIFIEDPADGTVGKTAADNSRLSSVGLPSANPGNGSSASVLLGKTKIDPYYLITQNMLGPLRADINSMIPPYSPYLFEGTDWPWDILDLHRTFALARVFYVSFEPPSPTTPVSLGAPILPTPGRRKSVGVPLPVNLGPFMGSVSPLPIEIVQASRASMVITTSKRGAKALKIAKVGILLRKDDTLDGGRRSTNRKWREFSVVLTGGQLLFFRNTVIASNLIDLNAHDDLRRAETEEALLNPDDVLVLTDAIALYDRTYTRYPYAFRFFMPNGRQFILQAPDEAIRNEWISSINYACSFKSAGVHIRGIGMSHKEIELTGVAAAASHLNDLRASAQANSTPSTIIHSFATSNTSPRSIYDPNSPVHHSSPSSNRFVVISNQVDLESPRSLHMEESRLFKATFDEVKAELAHSAKIDQLQGRSRTLSMCSRPPPTTKIARPNTAGSMTKSQDSHTSSSPTSRSRRDVVQTHVDLLDEKIKETQPKLEEELRLARNFAILTPFQRSTRDRIQAAVLPLAKKISSLRIEITKYTCYRFVLLSDLAEEERQWEQAKRDALQAASHRLSLDADNNGPEVPQGMSYSTEDANKQVKVSQSASTLESFYSATDKLTTSMALKPSLSAISTDLPASNGQSSELPTPAVAQSPLALESSDIAGELHERFYSAVDAIDEVAEEWNATRAAKRVSLVRVPSNVKPGRALRNANDQSS